MNAVLLLASPEFSPNRALSRALQRAKELGASVFAVVVITAQRLEQLAKQLVDLGFIGERLSEDVIEEVRDEQLALAEEVLEAVRAAAARESVPVETLVLEGDLAAACEAALAKCNIVHAVVAIPARGWLEKLWPKRRTEDWACDLSCPLEVVEE